MHAMQRSAAHTCHRLGVCVCVCLCVCGTPHRVFRHGTVVANLVACPCATACAAGSKGWVVVCADAWYYM